MLRRVIERLPLEDLRGVMRATAVANASITRWVSDGGRLVLAEYNSVSHLRYREPGRAD